MSLILPLEQEHMCRTKACVSGNAKELTGMNGKELAREKATFFAVENAKTRAVEND